MTLARLLELRAAMMENRQPEPPLNGSEYVTLVNCTEHFLRLAFDLGPAYSDRWISVMRGLREVDTGTPFDTKWGANGYPDPWADPPVDPSLHSEPNT